MEFLKPRKNARFRKQQSLTEEAKYDGRNLEEGSS
jgi:hypothetical protein